MKTSAQIRLDKYRAQAQTRNANNPAWKPADWQDFAKIARYLVKSPSMHRHEGKIYADSLNDLPGAIVENDKESRDRNACGYYVDFDHDGLMYGAVLKVRSSRGTYYIPVTFCTNWDGVTAYSNDVEHVAKGADDYEHEKAQRDAIRSARYYAEREAEQAREDNAKDRAEQDIYEARAQIHALNKIALPLFAELKKGQQFAAPVCDAIRSRIENLLEERAAYFKTIEERTQNFWSAVEY